MTDIDVRRTMNDNLTRIEFGPITLWISYETIIAFRVLGSEKRVSENVWTATTNRHMNEIDGKAKADRIPYADFTAELEKVLTDLGAAMSAITDRQAALVEPDPVLAYHRLDRLESAAHQLSLDIGNERIDAAVRARKAGFKL